MEQKEESKISTVYKHDDSMEQSNLISSRAQDKYKFLVCQICQNIPHPSHCLETTCCGYIFCESCIKTWTQSNNKCPICRIDINTNIRNIEICNKLLCRLLYNIDIKCPNNCNWQGKWDELKNHYKVCEGLLYECKYKNLGCKYIGTNKDIIEHENNKDKEHLEIIYNNFINNIYSLLNPEHIIIFDKDEVIKVSCHPHPLKFVKSNAWICDGSEMEGGCLSGNREYGKDIMRFSCDDCDFDLCNNCAYKYVTK